MAATAQHELSVAELKVEIERLSRELDQASSEKIQSAQLGLVLLEEKSSLQQRCDELESLYENARHELKFTQEALMKLDSTQKVTTRSGIEQENALINESAAMESSLTLQILELESETKQLRHELERVVSERDRLLTESSELGQDKATRESERAALRSELREARQREQRLLLDIENVEDENISLQKQVSALRSSQVEFEGLKHEVRQLREEAENARSAAEEMAALRRIAERQLAEALEALQAEREAKFAAKKELDAHLTREAAYNITNLAYSIRGMPEDGADDDGEPGGSSSAELATAMGDHHADLFSEVHLHEISRLEKQLEQAHNENSQLSSSMRAAQVTAENESAAAALLRGGLARAGSRLAALAALHGECSPAADDEPARWLTWWRVSGGELAALAAALAELAAAAPPPEGAPAAARAALAALADRAAEAEVRGAAARADAELLRALAAAAGRALAAAAPQLQRAADGLAALYHHVCAVNGTTAERLLLEHAGGADSELALAAGELEGLRAAAAVQRLADTLQDQLAHLRAALHAALDTRSRPLPGQCTHTPAGVPSRVRIRRALNRDGGNARASDQTEVSAVDEARTDRDPAHRAQVQQEHRGGRARQPQVQVRDREDHRHGDHAQTEKRAEAAQGRRGYLLKSARDVRGALRGVRDAGGRAHAVAGRRRGGEEDAQPAAAPRRAAEARAHAAPRGAGGGPRDAHAARAQGGGRGARARAGLLAAGVGAQGRGRRAAQHAARAGLSRPACAAHSRPTTRIYLV